MSNRSDTVKRTFYQDAFNIEKVWEVVEMKNAYYLRQYIKGIQFGKGVKTSKRFISSIGVFDFEKTHEPKTN